MSGLLSGSEWSCVDAEELFEPDWNTNLGLLSSSKNSILASTVKNGKRWEGCKLSRVCLATEKNVKNLIVDTCYFIKSIYYSPSPCLRYRDFSPNPIIRPFPFVYY